MHYLLSLLGFCVLCFNSLLAFASDAETALAKKSQNPVEDLISLPFNNNINYGFGPGNNTQYVLDIKPVIPFHLTSAWNLITRTIIPVGHQPNLEGRGYINGIGDINPSFFLSPAAPGRLIWGLGPALLLPTATNQQLGQGKYSLGPSFVILMMPGHWVFGIIANNVWSIGGESSRPAVNQFYTQYFINYNFSHGWFITTQPIITADWKQNSENRWTVPFGAGFGKVVMLGKQPLSFSLQAYGNAVKPKILGPNWQLQLNFSFLFPKA
jgi:hypothetical protein